MLILLILLLRCHTRYMTDNLTLFHKYDYFFHSIRNKTDDYQWDKVHT